MTAVVKPLSRSNWLKMRQGKIGGTTVAAIAGLDSFRTPIDVYNELCGLAPPVVENQVMEAGRLLEPTVVGMYCRRTGRKAKKTPVLVHPEYPFLVGTPDRRIWDKGRASPGILEAKTHGGAAFEKVREEGLYPSHVVQLLWYLGLDRLVAEATGGVAADWGSYAVLNRDRFDLITFDIEPDPVLFDSLVDLAVNFYRNYVEPRVPPPLVSEPQLNVTPVGGEAKVIDDAAIVGALAIYRDAKNVVEEAESALGMATDALKAALPEKGAFRLPAATIRYTVEAGRKTLERAALIADGIDPTKYERQGAPYEKFTVYLKKERK